MIKDFDIFTTVKWRNYVVNCCPKPPKLNFMDSGKQGVFLNRDGKIFFRSYDFTIKIEKSKYIEPFTFLLKCKELFPSDEFKKEINKMKNVNKIDNKFKTIEDEILKIDLKIEKIGIFYD
jgi:hypothetical protein